MIAIGWCQLARCFQDGRNGWISPLEVVSTVGLHTVMCLSFGLHRTSVMLHNQDKTAVMACEYLTLSQDGP
jgi:hypothetical protein